MSLRYSLLKIYYFIKGKKKQVKPRISKTGFWVGKNHHYFDKGLIEGIIKNIENKINKTRDYIYDFGCGSEALYTKYLVERGFLSKGFDGNPRVLKDSSGLATILDLAKKNNFISPPCEYLICLEVGEHIPPEFMHIFLDNLIDSTNKGIVLSWALRCQPGHGHVNCLDNHEVISIMQDKGLVYLPNESNFLRNAASLEWFKETIMVFEK